MGVLLDDEESDKSQKKSEDQSYKELFSKEIEVLNQILINDSFKPIHTETKRILSVLTGKPEEKAEIKEKVKAKFPGLNTINLLDDLDDIGGEDNKVSPDNSRASKEGSSSNKPPLEGITFDGPNKNEFFGDLVIKSGPVHVVKKSPLEVLDDPALTFNELKNEVKKTSSSDISKQTNNQKKDPLDLLDVNFN